MGTLATTSLVRPPSSWRSMQRELATRLQSEVSALRQQMEAGAPALSGPWLFTWPAAVSSSLVFRPATGSRPGRVPALVHLHLLLHSSL